IALGLWMYLWLGLLPTVRAQDRQGSVSQPGTRREANPGSQIRPLEPVPDPDLSGMEEVVLEQLRDGRSALMVLIKRPGVAPRELAQAYGNMGMLYQTYGLQEAAKVCYSNAAALAPWEFKWQYYLGYLFRATGELEKALVCFQNAMGIQSED